MPSILSLRTKAFYLGFFLFAILLFFYLSLNVHWSDSEIWSLALARDLSSSENFSVLYKSLFNWILHPIYWLPLDNVETIHASRLLFAGIGIGILLSIYAFVRELAQNTMTALWTCFLVFVSSLFLSQGFKVRSDLVAMLIQFIGLWYFVRQVQRTSSGQGAGWIGFLINLALLLTTPKAVFHFAVNLVFALSVYGGHPRRAEIKSYLLKAFGIPVGLFAILLIWKWESFASALEVFLRSYQEFPRHPAFWTFESARFVGEAIAGNWIALALSVVGALGLFYRKKFSLRAPLVLAALMSAFLIFFHSDRLPFFILGLSGMIFVLAGVASHQLWDEMKDERWKNLLASVVVLALLAQAFVYTKNILNVADNKHQVAAVQKMSEYLDQYPGAEYYDGTGVLPRENQIYAFPTQFNEGMDVEIQNILNRPSLSMVFFSNRMFYFFTQIMSTLDENFFIQIGPGVFARSHATRATHVVTKEEWTQVCERFGRPSKLYVYEGEGFMTMRPTANVLNCHESWVKIKTNQSFLAYTPYVPFKFDDDLSFAQIFDHKPSY